MQTIALWIACVLSLGVCALHVWLGGREAARPLLDSELRSIPKYTNYYAWHMVTIVIAAMGAAFAYAATIPEGRDVGIAALVLAVAFTLWSLTLILWKYRRPMLLPQWLLFLAVSVAAAIGLK
jgi:uncharacterized membrane protein YjjP (DUF1212 family)